MSYEPGGYADKLGNRYEGLWVVRQLLRVFNEEIHSVLWEPTGEDEPGVDLVITRADRTIEFQQCKARNGDKEFWDVASLKSHGILAKIKLHLDSGPAHEFSLTSGLPAVILGDVCESARSSLGDPGAFYRDQVRKRGQKTRKAFESFCAGLGLDSTQESDLARAFDYLRRVHIYLWPDDRNTREELHFTAAMLIDADPEVTIGALLAYAQENLRHTLTAEMIRAYLTSRNLNPRELVHDGRIGPALDQLRSQFAASIASGLVAGELIHRDETDRVVEMLQQGKHVILHGEAGVGKSGVLYELTTLLNQQGYTYLPVRLDRKTPENTAIRFGQALGLPTSPVACLAATVGQKPGILILDQLDALRWTSAHSADSLEVCKTLVREAEHVGPTGRAVLVILSCRTFDLEHDPEIKKWLDGVQVPARSFQKIKVDSLPEQDVKNVVQAQGQNYDGMSTEQRKILANPQHLEMWVRIVRSGAVPELRNATQLMREFWNSRYQALEADRVASVDAQRVLASIVKYMEDRGRISAPESLIIGEQRIYTALRTLGIIQTDAHEVTFRHQSYLDFLIADRVQREIYGAQGSVETWLGAKDRQSLFRREQLRHLLALLADESPEEFVNQVRQVVNSPNVRFHLKYLALAIVGHVEQPTNSMLDLARGLLGQETVQPHAVDLIYARHSAYVQSIIEDGTIRKWLEDPDEATVNRALWLLRSVNTGLGNRIAEVLETYVGKNGVWVDRVLSVLWLSPEDDSDGMFELRLRLARLGHIPHFFHWESFIQKCPERALRFLEAVLSTWDVLPDKSKSCNSGLGDWDGATLQHLEEVGSKAPALAWDLVVPQVQRLTSQGEDENGSGLAEWREPLIQDGTDVSFLRGVVSLLRKAGEELASSQPSEFLVRAHSLGTRTSSVMEEILLTSYGALPNTFSDKAIEWLLADTRRFEAGPGHDEPPWIPARNLIRTHSPHCSENNFHKLEEAILHYHSPDEKRLAGYYLPLWKKGFFGDYWGRTQFFLLPALCASHRSHETDSLIGVLSRKFERYSQERFCRGSRVSGGCVRSPLPYDRLHEISDAAWLGIIKNKQIPERDNRTWKQLDDDTVAESAIEHFASDLKDVALRYPDRFGRLALRFPEDVHHRYVWAIMEAMQATEPKNVPAEEKADWEPASAELVEAFLARYESGDDIAVALSFCWLIERRPDEKWSDQTIQRLVEYATAHPDPEPGKLNVYTHDDREAADKADVHSLVTNALNSVRGVAALAIEALLWKRPQLLDTLKPAMESLVRDPHPAVRAAAVQACGPVMNINRDLAVRWFVRACEDELRVAATKSAVQVFNCAFQSHYERLAPVVLSMLGSDSDEVAKEGATEICARWFFHGFFPKELEQCRVGRPALRCGVASIASAFLTRDEFSQRCRELLLPLLDDEDKQVREDAQPPFRKEGFFAMRAMPMLILRYLRTKAAPEGLREMLYGFKGYGGSLLDYADAIVGICDTCAGPLLEQSRDITTGFCHDVSQLSPLILRLYEQAHSCRPDVREKCLDMWDTLFEKRVGLTGDLMKEIDQR